MGFYGNRFLVNENNTIENISNTISVSFTEYCNYCSLLESCIDDNERTILEAKVEVLYEVSIKDIGLWIKKAINKIIEIIKEAWSKVKEFFRSKKSKMMEEEIKNLKKDVENLRKENIDLDKELKNAKSTLNKEKSSNENLRSENETLKTDFNTLKSNIETEKRNSQKKYDDLKSENETLKSDIDKQKAEKLEYADKLVKLMVQVAQNKYIYFDMYDYITDKFDPLRFVNSNEFERMFNIRYDRDYDGDERKMMFDMDSLKDQKYINIIKPEFLERMEKSGFNIRDGGYNHSQVHKFIKEDLKEKVDKTNLNEEKLMERLEWLTHGYQITACNTLCNKYNQLAGKLQNALGKYCNFDTNHSVEGKINKSNIRYYHEYIVNTSSQILRLISDNCRYLSVFCTYAGKASGAAEHCLLVYKTIIKNENK